MNAGSQCEKCGFESEMEFHLPVFSLLNCPGCGAQGSFKKKEKEESS